MGKFFIITIDTESDNQWNLESKQTTKNAAYIPRFQELCEKFEFKPVYFVDYTMANDTFLVDYLKKKSKDGKCEIGMHLHAWDTPPKYEYDKSIDQKGRPYLIEYPYEIMIKKINIMHQLLTSKFEQEIVSHRAGRWATNDRYLEYLKKMGYKVDCSFTPGIDWSKALGYSSGGSNYKKIENKIFWLDDDKEFLEVPMTIKKIHFLNFNSKKDLRNFIKILLKFILGRRVWFRPALSSLECMNKLITKNDSDYLEFMMHSSELMPGGSPYFDSKEDIEEMYNNLESIFSECKENGYVGITLRDLWTYYRKVEK